MIDISEPGRIEYTDEEKSVLRRQFLLTLHTLLIIYLLLHNFLIPFISNLVKGHNLLTEIHYWFLFQIPLHLWLRRKTTLATEYIIFLMVGSATRLIYESLTILELKSWAMLSILLSEFSSFVFYAVCWQELKVRRLIPFLILGVLIPPLLSGFEIRSIGKFPLPILKKTNENYKNLGCTGSDTVLEFPLRVKPQAARNVSIKSCGLEKSLLLFKDSLVIKNEESTSLSLRLYRLNILHGKVRWKFMRLVQIDPFGSWNVGAHLRNDLVYLVKAPERRRIGHVIIVSNNANNLPLENGKLRLTYDTVEWRAYE